MEKGEQREVRETARGHVAGSPDGSATNQDERSLPRLCLLMPLTHYQRSQGLEANITDTELCACEHGVPEDQRLPPHLLSLVYPAEKAE